MKAIGGFFELEINSDRSDCSYHQHGLALSTGRACLKFILEKTKPPKIYLPYYTCNALIEPIADLNIPYSFYKINKQFEIADKFSIGDNEFIIYINYFGLKNSYINKIKKEFANKLILDNTQAFFSKGDNTNWSFNSARKFFGVPDGAYLYGPDLECDQLENNTSVSTAHLVDRLNGLQQLAYQEYLKYEASLKSNVNKISIVSKLLLNKIDYEKVIKKRKRNFLYFFEAFKNCNLLEIDFEDSAIPFSYPLLLNKNIDKKKLFEAGIFIPSLWQDVNVRNHEGYDLEMNFANQILPLPIDHRYNSKDCEYICSFINNLITA